MAAAGFARGLLEKYGWSEGKGLGKNETGIAKALKPKLKFDTAGVGHRIDLTSQWWSKAFNDAAKSIKVDVSDGTTTVTKEAKKEKKKALPKHSYSGFIKAGVQDGTNWLEASPEPAVQEPNTDDELPENVLDEEIFKACGGLTAHKAARHGHNMSGKLKRVQEQEDGLCTSVSRKKKPSRKRPAVLRTNAKSQNRMTLRVLLRRLLCSRSQIAQERSLTSMKKGKDDEVMM
ncbi:G patch domain-containing protein 4 [Rhipicephalus sanguineus]|uniref:G patch domain-containing protein 4 n=1 Tax=Rhipicephalus sanguineus TaxID=34632 RepID=UPI0018935C86|nr:G patch domain-containing protein 4 [Rhipicephalus sanguineus]